VIRSVTDDLCGSKRALPQPREDRSLLVRIHLVDPEKGLVSVLVMESGKPTIELAPTPEDEEWFRTHSLAIRSYGPLTMRLFHSDGFAGVLRVR
jgi:hypothetical protein